MLLLLRYEEVEEKLRAWQKILRLQDWFVEVEIVRKHEMEWHTSKGEVWTRTNANRALIKLLDPVDDTCPKTDPYDMEETLVHELLHLHMDRFEPPKEDTIRSNELERTIDTLANVLVNLYRDRS